MSSYDDLGGAADNLSLAVSLADAGRFRNAEGPALRYLQQRPDDAYGWIVYANVASNLGQIEKALECYDRALSIDYNHFPCWLNRGVLLHRLERYEEAVISYGGALALVPNSSLALSNRALSHHELEQYSEEIGDLDALVGKLPQDASALVRRGNAHRALKDFRAAALDYAHANRLDGDNIEAVIGYGKAMAGLGRFVEAEQVFREALTTNPTSPEAHIHLGDLRHDQVDLPGAIECYDRALAIDPQHLTASYHKGFAALLSGDFKTGLPLYELRKELKHPRDKRVFKTPEWTGKEVLYGRTVFVYSDQGLGDTFQFCRFLRALEQRGANVIFAAHEGIHHLLRRSFPRVALIPQKSTPDNFDTHLALASLPFLLGITSATIPVEVPYLFADAALVDHWKTRLELSCFNIGIAWQGTSDDRSFALRWFRELSEVPGVRLVSLQSGTGTEQTSAFQSSNLILFPELDRGADAFRDTAALMDCLDLIVTPDTSLAHLAGAMNRPACILLKQLPDWRWMLHGSNCRWYPSVRLIRQQSFGDWGSAFAALRAEVQRVKQKRT